MKIKDIGKIVTGKTPSTKNENNFNGNILFITPSDITCGSYIGNTSRTISEQGFKAIKTNTISGYSILVGCIGSDMGNVAWTDKTCATNQQINSITEINSDINPLYIYYYLSTKKELLQKLAGTTTTPILPKSVFEEIDITIPEKYIQDKIVDVLKSIDDKISNNNRINAELDSMAKTIYDYWFTQFDFPNENGKPYRSSGGKMAWNEELKREIPEGWGVGNLYDIADFINGLACQKFRPKDDIHKLPVIKITEMHDGITENTEYVSDDIPEKNIIIDGDILFSWSATLETMIWTGGKAGLNQHIFKVIPKINSKYYVYMQLSAYIINFIQMAEARKTTMGHITTDHLIQSKIVLPPIDVSKRFDDEITVFFEKAISNDVQNRKLASLRDWLLPMLMNGQVGFEGESDGNS